MKKIEAIIRPEKLSMVKKALEEVGYPGLMVIEVKGHGRQKGVVQHFRGTEFIVEMLPKVKIELVVPDAMAAPLVKVIAETARSGEVGDGKVFVSLVEEALRVRTGESGDAAL